MLWIVARSRPSLRHDEEFAEDFCRVALRANALYMDRYPLVSALSRPLIVRHLAEAARVHGATVVSHGCTGKGNDQVRFEVGMANLAPELAVIAPVRDYAWTRKGNRVRRGEGLPIQQSKSSPYSIDQNVWGPGSGRQASSRTSGMRPSRTPSAYTANSRHSASPTR